MKRCVAQGLSAGTLRVIIRRMAIELDFTLLDDVALAVERRQINVAPHLAKAQAVTIGPLVELAMLERQWPASGLAVSVLPNCPLQHALRNALTPGSLHPAEGLFNQVRFGFVQTGRDPLAEDQSKWDRFCLSAQGAAVAVGLPKQMGRQLIGAMREIEDNVHLHSGRARDGIVGYRATVGAFEFVVADSGIGALQSLRSNPRHADLRDAGTAIHRALTDGVSRFDEESGHGFGFHSLFVGLANSNGFLRFRSGDHTLTLDGASPSLLLEKIEQRSDFQGFSASALCRLP